MKIKVFADTICGWCYIGHSRLLKALNSFEHISFNLEHGPFQLNPDMPKKGISRLDYLKYKFGSKEASQPMYDSMTAEALKEDLKFNLDKIHVTPNTNLSHILTKLAWLGYGVNFIQDLHRGKIHSQKNNWDIQFVPLARSLKFSQKCLNNLAIK